MSVYRWTVSTQEATSGQKSPYATPFTFTFVGALAPTLLTPANATESPGTSFTWDFNTNNAQTQAAFAFRRRVSGGWRTAILGTPSLASNMTGDVAVSPDGQYVAANHNSLPYNTVLDASDWSIIGGTPVFGSGYGTSLAFSPDSARLAVAAFKTTAPYMQIWNTADWSVVSGTPDPGVVVSAMAYSPNGLYLIVSNASFAIRGYLVSDWSLLTGAAFSTFGGTAQALAFSPDGSKLAVGKTGSPYFHVINTSDWSIVAGTPTMPGIVYGLAFSPDGSHLAVAHSNSPFLRVLDTSNWSVVSGTPVLGSEGRGCSFTPDGAFLAVGTSANNLKVLNTADWSVLSDTFTAGSSVRDVVFFPNGTLLAMGHNALPYLSIVQSYFLSYWNGTTWQDTEVFITSATESLSLPSNAWE